MEQLNNTTKAVDREDKIQELRNLGVKVPLRDLSDSELDELLVWYGKNPEHAEVKDEEEIVDDHVGEVLAVPPRGLSGSELREWWEEQLLREGIPMSQIPTTNDYERLCMKCGSINPCTGVSTCIQCGVDISPETGSENFKRIETSNLHSPSGQR